MLSEEEISPEELEDNEDMLIRLMHDKFLYGLDKGVNYAALDNDEGLDD